MNAFGIAIRLGLSAISLANALLPAMVAGTHGPLRFDPDQPYWFIDTRGRGVWLAGSHTWANRQERGLEGATPDFDYDRYLGFLAEHGHNFVRLWAWEHAQWMQFTGADISVRYRPLPYARTGPGQARDGKPKFDLTQFNPDYYDRLRRRVELARDRGCYVAVMLFQGFSLSKNQGDTRKGNAWHGHPFHPENNINGIDGSPGAPFTGHEVHTLKHPEITRLQEAYVRKTIDALNDLDNVLWEIGNECHVDSVEWQAHMIRFIRDYERSLPAQHLIGMTGAPIQNPALFSSPADWVSPVGKQYLNNPPVSEARKIVVSDTDHIAPVVEITPRGSVNIGTISVTSDDQTGRLPSSPEKNS